MADSESNDTISNIKNEEGRVSGDSRRYRNFTKGPDLFIKSALGLCNMEQYLDLIVQSTRNNQKVFLSMDVEDLKLIGIENEQHCLEIEKAIKIVGGKNIKYNFNISRAEAVQILENIEENLSNIDQGLVLFMDDMLLKPPDNFFTSDFNTNTAAHDALEFIQSAKYIHRNLVKYLNEKQIFSDNECKTILNYLDAMSPLKLKKRKKVRKILSWSLLIGTIAMVTIVTCSKFSHHIIK